MEAIIEFLQQWGYIGVFLGATLPIMSADALILSLLAVGGNPVLAVVSATMGNWVGSMLSYWLGRLGKWEWIEKYFKVKEESMEKQRARVEKFGSLLGLATGIPLIGDVFAVALGFFRINPWKCAPSILIGKGVRFTIVTLIFLAGKAVLT